MAEVLAVINQKGGVAKSTTALALGQGLAKRGKKILFIDLDAQANLSYCLNAQETALNILQVLTNQADIKNAIQSIYTYVDLIQSSPQLSGADSILTTTGKEYRLKEVLTPVLNEYDYIIIDTPPALSILTINALTCCSGAIIPAQADFFSLQGIGQLAGTIGTVKQYCNSKLKILGILLTRYSGRAVISRDVATMLEDTAKQLGTKLYETKIRECVAIKEAQAQHTSIYDYAPRSNAVKDYNNFINEVIQ